MDLYGDRNTLELKEFLLTFLHVYMPSFCDVLKLFLLTFIMCLLWLQDVVVSFPLYSEALKFAQHGEKMIQTAVRALTLNIYNGIFLLF